PPSATSADSTPRRPTSGLGVASSLMRGTVLSARLCRTSPGEREAFPQERRAVGGAADCHRARGRVRVGTARASRRFVAPDPRDGPDGRALVGRLSRDARARVAGGRRLDEPGAGLQRAAVRREAPPLVDLLLAVDRLARVRPRRLRARRAARDALVPRARLLR